MKHLGSAVLVLFLLSPAFDASALGKIQGYVERGGGSVISSLSGSSIRAQKSFPGATVRVYVEGTTTLVSAIYSNATLTAKSNPFTADSTGFYFFFINDGCYDLNFDDGTTSWTISKVCTAGGSESGCLNVLGYGAVGDGVTDDTAAIQRASVAGGAGSIICFPEGTYMYGGNITLHDNQTFAGSGAGSSILKYRGSGDETLFKYDDPITPLVGLTIRDLGFDMNGKPDIFASFINVQNAKRTTIENNRLFDSNPPSSTETIATGDGVTTSFSYTMATAGSTQPKSAFSTPIVITAGSLTATDDGYGGWTGDVASPGSVLYNRTSTLTVNFSSAPGNGTPITVTYKYSDQRFGILVNNSDSTMVRGNRLSHAHRIRVGSNTHSATITGNHVYDTNDNAITCVMDTNGQVSKGIVIAGNVVRNPSSDGIYFGMDDATETGGTLEQITITGNVITNAANAAIGAKLPALTSGIAITGNTITMKYTTSISASCGIKMLKAGDATTGGKVDISGNAVEGGFQLAGIAVEAGANNSIVGNLIAGTNTRPDSGIHLSLGAADTLVASNKISGTNVGINFIGGGSGYARVNMLSNDITGPGTSTTAGGVTISGAVISVADCRLQGGSIRGYGFGIRHVPAIASELDIIDVRMDDNATGEISLVAGSWAAASQWQKVTSTFAALPSIRNGSTIYCTDCTKAAPTAGGGTGAIVKRENGAWNGD